MASVQEGMAMVQIQALACGLPLICTTNTGGEDLLKIRNSKPEARAHGIIEFDAGYVVPIRSPEAIAWCLRELAERPGLWEAKRKYALELSIKDLSWKSYAHRAANNYKKLILAN
jgi:glycosyltransferase involved in cell wall biosynthesis